jgi:predicted dinucleotide-binding enzyme
MSDITPRIDFTAELAGLFDLKGKVAYVAGGYGGLGEAIAWGLAQRGAKVAVSGRSGDKAEALAASLRAAGHDALGLAMDAHDVAHIRASVDAVAQHFGAIDILMNCVGIQREEALLEVSEEAYDEVIAVNLKAAMFLGQAAARAQVKLAAQGRKGAKQVHLLSVASPVRAARAWLLGLLQQQGRPGDADQATRDGARAARHHRQRRRADGGAHGDGAALGWRTRRRGRKSLSAFRLGGSPIRATWSARRCSSAALRRTS